MGAVGVVVLVLLHVHPIPEVHVLGDAGVPDADPDPAPLQAAAPERGGGAEHAGAPDDAPLTVEEAGGQGDEVHRQHPGQAGHRVGRRHGHLGVGRPEGVHHLHAAQAEPPQRLHHLRRGGVGRVADHHPGAVSARAGVLRHCARLQGGVELPLGPHRHQGGEAVAAAEGRERGPLRHQGIVGVTAQVVAQGDAQGRQGPDVRLGGQLLELH